MEVFNGVGEIFILSEPLMGGFTYFSELLSSLDIDGFILLSTLSVEPGLFLIESILNLGDKSWVSEFSVGSIDNLMSVVIDITFQLVLSELGLLNGVIIIGHFSLKSIIIIKLLLGKVVERSSLGVKSGGSLLLLLLDLVLGFLLHLLLSLSGSLLGLVSWWLLGICSWGGLGVLLNFDLLFNGVVLDQAAVSERNKSALVQLDSDLDSEFGLLDLGGWNNDAGDLTIESFWDGIVVESEVDLLLVLEGQTLDIWENASLLEQFSTLGLNFHSAVLLGDEFPLNLDVVWVAVLNGVGQNVELWG